MKIPLLRASEILTLTVPSNSLALVAMSVAAMIGPIREKAAAAQKNVVLQVRFARAQAAPGLPNTPRGSQKLCKSGKAKMQA